VAELVAPGLLEHEAPGGRRRPLRDDDDREPAATRVPTGEARADVVEVEGLLGHQHHVGTPGDARPQRDPARVATHHLHDHHAVVALGGGVQPVDHVDRDLDRGVEAEGDVGGREIVVDGLGRPDHRDPEAAEPLGHSEGVLAADRHQRVDPPARERRLERADRLARPGERVRARRAEDGPAPMEDASGRRDRQRDRVVVDRPAPAVPEPHELVTVDPLALTHERRITALSPGQSPPPPAPPVPPQDRTRHDRTGRSLAPPLHRPARPP